MISLVIILLILSCSDPRKEQQAGNRNTTLDPNYINDSTRVLDQQYQKSVFGFIRTKTLEFLSSDTALRNTDNRWNLARTKVVLEYCTDPTVRNFWLYVIVKDQLENYGIKNTDAMMKTFYENSTDSASAREIRELYSSNFEGRKGHTIIPYKTVGGFSLDAHIFFPGKHDKQHRPAIVLFHGGSWSQGKPEWVFGSAKRYASKGLVAIAIEYRLYDRHGSTPRECISDAKSALRWVRKNAVQLGVDPNKIIASGFSAGGHLVACAAMLGILDDADEDTTISTVPNATIFSSSCFDPTLDPWFVKEVEQQYEPREVSPNHNVRSGLPPSLVIHGTEDRMCPFRTAEEFAERMRNAGNRCELHRLQGATHFYFFEKKYRDEAIQSEEKFLASLGFLSRN
jgi:acetyl esterase/lipase